MKTQQYKIDAVASLKEGLEQSRSFIFADYRGLTVDQITELRRSLRESGAEFHVVKNNYAKIAFRQMDHEGVIPYLLGPTAVAYCSDEAGPAAKKMFQFSKNMSVEVKGGLVDGVVYDAAAVEAFSALPTKPELIQMLLGTMQAPVRNMACVLNGIVTKLVRTLDAVREKKAQDS